MSASQRDKGQRGERELFGILSDLLGTCVRRNVDQARNGGALRCVLHERWAIRTCRDFTYEPGTDEGERDDA